MSDKLVDVGYRDPCDERDDEPDPPPSREEYEPLIAELDRGQLEHELAFGGGVRQVLARQELERRAGDGHQLSLFGPIERLAQTRRHAR